MRHEKFDVEVIIGYMDGNMSSTPKELIESEFEGMTYEDLTDEEKHDLQERIQDCQGCGWPFDAQNMETIEDVGPVCWRCEEDYRDGQEDEDDEG